MSKEKRGKGQFYTQNKNPFDLYPFQEWLLERVENGLDVDILEPFAGQNNIPNFLRKSGMTNNFVCYDIEPKESVLDNVIVQQRDTIIDFPTGFTLAITNPPFLSKSSASRLKFDYPECDYDDIYKFCLKKMLDNVKYVASIVPESFITSKEFTERLYCYISLTDDYFTDTEVPVGLALFNSDCSDDFLIYRDEQFLGYFNDLKKYDIEKPKDILNLKVVFNDPQGKLALHAIDSSNVKKIRFGHGNEIDAESIKHYSRAYSRITILQNYVPIEIDDELIDSCNNILMNYRNNTKDVFLTSFKNKNKEGLYRRRIDWQTTRNIILVAIHNIYRKKLIKEAFKTKYF
jgi:hypothetical protein